MFSLARWFWTSDFGHRTQSLAFKVFLIISFTKRAPFVFTYNIITFGICISNSSKNSLTLSLRGDVEITRVS